MILVYSAKEHREMIYSPVINSLRCTAIISTNVITNRQNSFINCGNGQFVSQDQDTKFDKLIKSPDGTYTLNRKDQSVCRIDNTGKLMEQDNSYGQKLVFIYDNNGKLLQITEPVSGPALSASC